MEPGRSLFTGTFERQMEGSGTEASLIILCGTEEETSVHNVREYEAFASLRHVY